MRSYKIKISFQFICLIILVFIFSGCAKLRHLSQLLALNAYAKNKMKQDEYVAHQKQQFAKLLEVVSSGKIDEYKTKERFMEEFGEPVVTRSKEKEGKVVDLWMYRFVGSIKSAEKIYLYFDSDGNLEEWEHYVPKNLQSAMKYQGGPG